MTTNDIAAIRDEVSDLTTARTCCPENGTCAVCAVRAHKLADRVPALCDEIEHLRNLLEAVESYVGKHGDGEVDVWSLRELLAGRPTLEHPQGVTR